MEPYIITTTDWIILAIQCGIFALVIYAYCWYQTSKENKRIEQITNKPKNLKRYERQ